METYTEPLATRKAYGEARAACGGGEDGRREGDRGHRARATGCGGERRMVVEALFGRLVQHLMECAAGARFSAAVLRPGRGVAERQPCYCAPHAGFATIR